MQFNVSWVRCVLLEARRCPPFVNGKFLDHIPEIVRACALSQSSTRFACWHRANAGRSKSPSASSTVLFFPAPPSRILISSGSENRQQASCCRPMYGSHACRTNLAHVDDTERAAAEPQPAAGSSTPLNTSGGGGGMAIWDDGALLRSNSGEKGSTRWLQAAMEVSPRLAGGRRRRHPRGSRH